MTYFVAQIFQNKNVPGPTIAKSNGPKIMLLWHKTLKIDKGSKLEDRHNET